MTEGPDNHPYYADLLRKRIDPKWERFSWITLRALFSSANDVVAKGTGALVDDRRQRWVAAQRAAGALEEFPDLVVDLSDRGVRSFIVIGDTGEADDSQYAVVEPLLGEAKGTAFMLIASDVIYPAGDVNDYVNGFYVPYGEYERPIYAIPGNHDWYDGLEGFMFHFCGAEALPRVDVDPTSFKARERLWRLAWRRASAPRRAFLQRYRSRRPPWNDEPSARHQPGPYFALDLGRLLVVCIDTGVVGEIDAEQGAWLRRISARSDREKLLVTGKPLYVDNRRRPGEIADYFASPEEARNEPHRFVDEIVRDPAHRYIGAIGGDVHNYQRYTVPAADHRPLKYFVSGGGGAYLGNTHKVRADGVDTPGELSVDCTYPSAEESLNAYARELVPKVWRTVRGLRVVALGIAAAVALVILEAHGAVSYPTAVSYPAFVALVLMVAARVALAFKWPRAEPRRFRALLVGLFAAGAELLLLARIATDGHDWKSFETAGDAVVFGVAGTGCALALVGAGHFARERGDQSPSVLVRLTWAAAALMTAVASLGLVWHEVGLDRAWQVLLGISVVVILGALVLIDGWLGRLGYPASEDTEDAVIEGLPRRPAFRPEKPNGRWARRLHRARGPLVVAYPVAVAAIVALLWRSDERAGIAALVTLVAFLQIPVALVFVYEFRRSSPNAILWICAIYGAVATAVWRGLDELDASWVARYLAGLACVVGAALVVTLFAYLYWLRGFSLWAKKDARAGVLDADGFPLDNARAFLAWHAGTGNRPDGRVVLIGRIVIPSRRKVRSPAHRLLAEVFEPGPPRLYKSFLRVDVQEDAVHVTCYGVTGASPVAAQVDSVALPSAPLN